MNQETDIALELLKNAEESANGISLDESQYKYEIVKSLTNIKTAKAAREIGKPVGKYCSIEGPSLGKDCPEILSYTAKIVCKTVKDFLEKPTKILVVGLGNNRFVADSLGPKVCDSLNASERLVLFVPSVSGVTGIKSTDAIRAIAGAVKPSHVIVIDSLACTELSRLGSSYQVSTSGIQPGSGITRDNARIDDKFLGCPVLALGVPLVSFMPSRHSLYVVPKNIDAVVARCAYVISSALQSVI